MSIKSTLILLFGVTSIVFIGMFAMELHSVREGVALSREFHGRALAEAQHITYETFEAIEECFGYLLTGNQVERDEFIAWSHNYQAHSENFRTIAHLTKDGEADEERFYRNMVSSQEDITKLGLALFEEYDKKPVVSRTLLNQFEAAIDRFSTNNTNLIEHEEEELFDVEEDISTLLDNTRLTVYTSIAVMLLMLFITYTFLSFNISKPLGRICESIDLFSDGKQPEWPKFSGASEISKVSIALEKMAENIQRKTHQLDEANKHKQELIDSLHSALDEVKTLKGVLPICSHCKKIRNDDGAWNQLESYIVMHTQAEFTHGICPDCIQKYYRDVRSD